jgi:hypothetical protein
MTFPLKKEEWYETRDDRTRRIDGVKGFEGFSIAVIVSPLVKSSYAIQVMTLTSLNMLARWCRKIRIQMLDAESKIPVTRGQNLRELLEHQLPKIDPYGEFTFGEIGKDECSQTLFIRPPDTDASGIWIDGSGWVAGVGNGIHKTAVSEDDSVNPVGPAFASCLGVAELFRQAVKLQPILHKQVWYSLYDYSKTENLILTPKFDYDEEFHFGRVYQIGCGAVASSLDYLLSLTNWNAELHLIDYDKVDVTNCNRSIAFTANDAVSKRDKVDSCAEILPKTITPLKFRGSYAEFVQEGKVIDLPADLILCLANEQNVWETIQHNIPPLTLHATTTPNWGINFGRHVPKKEWCIMCRFYKDIDYHFTPACAEGEIKSSDGEQKALLGVLPYLSTTAAVFILAELAKMPLPNYPLNKSLIQYSTKIADGDILQEQRKARESCICKEQSPELFKHVTGAKFWKLSL